jgi:hypothetical protein
MRRCSLQTIFYLLAKNASSNGRGATASTIELSYQYNRYTVVGKPCGELAFNKTSFKRYHPTTVLIDHATSLPLPSCDSPSVRTAQWTRCTEPYHATTQRDTRQSSHGLPLGLSPRGIVPCRLLRHPLLCLGHVGDCSSYRQCNRKATVVL